MTESKLGDSIAIWPDGDLPRFTSPTRILCPRRGAGTVLETYWSGDPADWPCCAVRWDARPDGVALVSVDPGSVPEGVGYR